MTGIFYLNCESWKKKLNKFKIPFLAGNCPQAATQSKQLCDPLLGHQPPVKKHCTRGSASLQQGLSDQQWWWSLVGCYIIRYTRRTGVGSIRRQWRCSARTTRHQLTHTHTDTQITRHGHTHRGASDGDTAGCVCTDNSGVTEEQQKIQEEPEWLWWMTNSSPSRCLWRTKPIKVSMKNQTRQGVYEEPDCGPVGGRLGCREAAGRREEKLNWWELRESKRRRWEWPGGASVDSTHTSRSTTTGGGGSEQKLSVLSSRKMKEWINK